MIKCNNISKKYGLTQILNDVNLEIKTGEITVLIGPSGSGKTTLLKHLTLIENADSGQIIIDSDEYIFPSKITYRKHFEYNHHQQVGVVFQNLLLIPHWTNRQNILTPVSKVEIDYGKLEELIQLLNLTKFIDKFPHQCSRGEQQRIAIAKAIMLNPKYLFLDEITSALDPELIAIVFKYLLQLKEKGVGIFLVTHFLLFAQNVADKIIFLQNGEIVEQGTNQIMQNPMSNELQLFLDSISGIIVDRK